MDIISPINNFSPIGGDENSRSAYWLTLLSSINYSHPMLPGLWLKKVGTKYIIQTQTIDDFRKVYADPIIKYVDSVNGLDTNNGNTALTAYKTIGKLQSVTWNRAYLAAGCYASTLSLIGAEGEVIGADKATTFYGRGYLGTEKVWTDAGGGMFSCSITPFHIGVVDCGLLDANGDPTMLTLVASSAAVAATAGTYYWDDPTDTLYVHMSDGLTPSRSNVILSYALQSYDAGKINYVENLTIIGGCNITNGTATKNVVLFKNSKVLYNRLDTCLNFQGNVWIWLEGLTVKYSFGDNVSLKMNGIYNPLLVEVDCIMKDAGKLFANTTHINNTSTTHHGVVSLRVNGDYSESEGTVVHDVNEAVSLNVNCYAHDSVSTQATHKTAFGSGTSEDASISRVYLYECRTSGADTQGVKSYSVGTSHIYGKKATGIHSVAVGTTLEVF